MSLPAARDALAGLLSGLSVTVADRMPERVQPPVALILPADPYVDTDPTELPYGMGWVYFDVVLIAAKATNPTQDRSLDDLITEVLQALYGVSGAITWLPRTVSRPTDRTLGEQTYLETRVRVRATFRMTT